jgi:SAM-dependent methyltransferase
MGTAQTWPGASDTDLDWEAWGARDPYYGVLTHDRFRAGRIDDEARREFFRTGVEHVEHVLALCRRHVDPGFAPRRVLDFGCGVGRVAIPFARHALEVVGVDVSVSMLAEARANCAAHGCANVVLLPSDDGLSAVPGSFDLVHSYIVLQHVDAARGLGLVERLLERIRPGGIGVIHVTYGVRGPDGALLRPEPAPAPAPAPVPAPAETRSVCSGRPSALGRLRLALRAALRPARSPEPPPSRSALAASCGDPDMQLHAYDLGALLHRVQAVGAVRLHVELTDHGGALGVLLCFSRPRPAAADPAARSPGRS